VIQKTSEKSNGLKSISVKIIEYIAFV